MVEQERMRRVRRNLIRRLGDETRDSLSHLALEGRDTPPEMAYFYDIYRKWADPVQQFSDPRPVIAISCMQVPLELILACGARPFRLCNGSAALEQAGSESLPAKACSVVRATVGMLSVFQEALKERLALVVVPTTCDQKRKAVEMMGEKGFPVYALETPPAKNSEAAAEYWRRSVTNLIPVLEKATGNRITRKRLASAISEVRQASRIYRALSAMVRHDPPLFSGLDMFVVMNAFMMDDTASWVTAADRLTDTLMRPKEEKNVSNLKKPRILVTGSPPLAPGLKLPLLLEEAGAAVVADEVCSCSRLLHDTVSDCEPRLYDMIPAVADRYLKPCTCPVFDSSEDRRRLLAESAKKSGIDGVVYQSYSGCQLYQMEQTAVGSLFKELDIPVLIVETDYAPEDRGRITTRIEAFLESIWSRTRST